MKITLRPFENSDTQVVMELFHDTVHQINSKDYQQTQLDAWAPAQPDFKRWQHRLKDAKTIVAELDGRIIGFGNLDKDSFSIGMLYVHKDFQRKGVASELMAALEKKLRKKEIVTASLEASITARPFFEKIGYHVVRENRKALNGIEFLNYVMEKDLSVKEEPVMSKEEKPQKIEKIKTKGSKPFQWRDLFINKAFDLIMVILGVYIAFQLTNIKLDDDQKALERFYLESMLADMKKDLNESSEILATLKEDKKCLVSYLSNLKKDSVTTDSLGHALAEIVQLDTFAPNQNTYQTLVASNGLSTISDRDTRRLVTEYYTTYTSIHRFESIYTSVLFKVIDYFGPDVDFREMRVLNAEIINKPQTTNFMVVAISQLNDGIEIYENSLKNGSELVKNIESQLK